MFFCGKGFSFAHEKSGAGWPPSEHDNGPVRRHFRERLLLKLAWQKKELKFQEGRILIFPDISPIAQERKLGMLEDRKKCVALNVDAVVVYPVKLRVKYRDKTFIFLDVSSARLFLEKVERDRTG